MESPLVDWIAAEKGYRIKIQMLKLKLEREYQRGYDDGLKDGLKQGAKIVAHSNQEKTDE